MYLHSFSGQFVSNLHFSFFLSVDEGTEGNPNMWMGLWMGLLTVLHTLHILIELNIAAKIVSLSLQTIHVLLSYPSKFKHSLFVSLFVCFRVFWAGFVWFCFMLTRREFLRVSWGFQETSSMSGAEFRCLHRNVQRQFKNSWYQWVDKSMETAALCWLWVCKWMSGRIHRDISNGTKN